MSLGLLFCWCAGPWTVGAAAAEGVRVELPAGGAVRVENWRGSVHIEVWNEKDVSVAALIDGAAPKTSPVIVERTAKLLKIGVVRQKPGTPPQRVDLLIRVPERARAEIVTSSGEIRLRGTPAEFKARTIKGDIRAEIFSDGDTDVTAETLSGKIDSTLTATTVLASERLFHATLGSGRNLVRLRSERGRIALVPAESRAETPVAVPAAENVSAPPPANPAPAGTPRRPPTLVGGDNRGTGAGTPATPLSSPEEIDEEDIVRVDTELVTVNMSVIDRGTNRGLAGLAQTDFKVYEDGMPQQIAHFDAASTPFNLVLLIDLSSSTQDVVKLLREAALHFVDAARPNDRISVITFGSVNVLVSPLTSDREALRRSIISTIDKHQGSTNLYDALNFAMEELQKSAGDSRRNAIVLMSDGLDSTMPNVPGDGSKLEYHELLRRVREMDGVLYTLWLNTETEYSSLSALDIQGETFDLAHDRMAELADAGGGIFYEVEALEDLAGAYERVVADLGTVYSLGYRPTNKLRDGKWRAIRVQVSRPQAVARGKRGYYAN